jgi:hypothetical protein
LKDNIILEKADYEDEEERQNGGNALLPSSWENISNKIINSSKKVGTMPSLEEFHSRLNLFRKVIIVYTYLG